MRRLPARRCAVALCGSPPAVGLASQQQRLSEDLPWARPANGVLGGVEVESQADREASLELCRPARPAPRGASTVADQQDIEALAARLRSDPEFCRRVASSVDAQTSERWVSAREDAEAAAAEAALTEARAHARDPTVNVDMTPRPEAWQLWYLHVRTAVPFIGFGFFDNMIMLTVGGAIESTIGVAFGISTLAAAGMGQMVSDASGITLQGLIERFADKLGLPHPRLSLEQQQLAFVKSFMLASRIFGIVFGCALGMFPLMLLPEKQHCLVDQIVEALPAQRQREFMALVTKREFQVGETILRYGEMSDFVFLVDSGEVDCVGRDFEGLPFHVCALGPGQSFGKPQLHCPSHVDLIAKDGPVVVQCIEKDDFMRITGQQGLEVWESTRSAEHGVYFAAQGGRIVEAVPPASRGMGKTRMFASLSDADKVEVLRGTGLEQASRFKGVPNEGKVTFFARLSETQKHDALDEWHRRKFGRPRASPEGAPGEPASAAASSPASAAASGGR